MFATTPLVLAADDPVLAVEIKARLEEALEQDVAAHDLGGLRPHLDQLCHGALLLAVSSPAAAIEARLLVQELRLTKCPATVILLEDPALAGRADLSGLDGHIAARLTWPEDASEMVHLARRAAHRCRAVPRTLTDDEELRARLARHTPSLLPLADLLILASRHHMPVLISGETGTGKTFLARLVHDHSARRNHRFLPVPCGAISAALVESELFGHVKGAFTGADRDKVGKFAAVGEGTLLLDEIDTLGLEQQAALLRVIETGEFEPVGSIETQTCRGRLVVASNINLEEAVERSRFRADLYFRLNVMSFHLPSLRERVQDIAPLARTMAARFNRKFGKNLFDIHPATLTVLEAFSWPGNIRQLENVLQHAVLMSSGPELLPSHLPPVVGDQVTLPVAVPTGSNSLSRQRDLTERTAIQRALLTHGHSRCRAAASLGISRVTLYKKMKKHGLLDVPAVSGPAE